MAEAEFGAVVNRHSSHPILQDMSRSLATSPRGMPHTPRVYLSRKNSLSLKQKPTMSEEGNRSLEQSWAVGEKEIITVRNPISNIHRLMIK